MSISKQTVEYVAHLARITLKAGEPERLTQQLKDIVDFIDQLKKVAIDNVEPTSHILPLNNVLREDKPAKSLTSQQSLANAPRKEDAFFGVPKVIE